MKNTKAISFDWFHREIPWPGISLRVAKELRVIVPVAFLGTVALMILGFSGPLLASATLFALVCSAIGSLAVGHDFSHRTLNSLLALPIDRKKLWQTRLRVAFWVMFLCALAITAADAIKLLTNDRISPMNWSYWSLNTFILCAIAILDGLLLAPWLTLVSRSVMFGTVFSLAIPFLLGRFLHSFLGIVGFLHFPILWIIGGILGQRAFVRLEALDAQPTGATRRGTRTDFQKTHPYWQLLKKELMLLRMGLLIAVVCAIVAMTLSREQMVLFCISCPVFLSAVIGSVASADERQLGTAPWQITQPIAFWRQWLVKVSTTLSVAIVCAVLLPLALLKWKNYASDLGADQGLINTLFVVGAILAASISLHASSLSQSSLKALIISLFGLGSFLGILAATRSHFIDSAQEGFRWAVDSPGLEQWPNVLLLFAVIAMALVLAGFNHRYSNQTRANGFFWFTIYVIIGALLIANFISRAALS